MDLTFLNEFIVIITLTFCLGIGYVVKTSLDFIPNKYIPLIIGVIGIVFNCFVDGVVNPSVIVSGLISRLASTGMYELFRNLIEKQ